MIRTVLRSIALFVAAYVGGLVLLSAYKQLNHYPDYVIPPTLDIMRSTVALGQHYTATLFDTYVAATAGYLLSILLAVGTATVIFVSGRAGQLIRSTVFALQAYPIVAVVPLLFIVFGEGLRTHLTIVAAIAYFPMLLVLLSALTTPQPEVEQFFRNVYPKAHLRIVLVRLLEQRDGLARGLAGSYPLSVVGAIVAEMVAINSGIGYSLRVAHAANNLSAVAAALFLIGVCSAITVALLDSAIGYFARRYPNDQHTTVRSELAL